VASETDALWFDIGSDKPKELDLDSEFKFGEIKCIQCYKDKFYVLCNKLHSQLGYYLLELPTNLGLHRDDTKFVIKWTNKLHIGDGSIDVFTDTSA
jgi:hypothetical protein